MSGNSDHTARRRAAWLPRLASPEELPAAADALRQIEHDQIRQRADEPKPRQYPSRKEMGANNVKEYREAIELIDQRLPDLIPHWIARLLERIAAREQHEKNTRAARQAGEEVPQIDWQSIYATRSLQFCLQAAGPNLDPYLRPLIDAFGKFGRWGDEDLAAIVQHAGPAIRDAVPAMLHSLETNRDWRRPSMLAAAFVNASRHDSTVIPRLQQLLSHPESEVRQAAMNVLGHIGPDALSTAPQLLAFRNADENERCHMLHALARQRATGPEFLNVFAEALIEPNGYVRRSAAWALGELKIAPERFVPLLIDCLDWTEPLHDTSLPEAAAAALAQYGPDATAALPRLRRFLEGPIQERTLSPKDVRRAIEAITGKPLEEPLSPRPPFRPEPPADDEPLFAVTYQSRQAYIDRQGRIVIHTTCGHGEEFSCGRAIVRYDERNRKFVIDRRGDVVFEITWDDMKSYAEGLAAVEKDGKWGFVDTEGRIIIEPKYDSVTSFCEGLAGFEIGRSQKASGKSFTRIQYGHRGYINRAGKQVIPARFHQAGRFSDARALVSYGGVLKPNEILDGELTLKDETRAYIDPTGRVVFVASCPLPHGFHEGRAVVTTEPHPFTLQYGYIDVDGNVIVPQILKAASRFKDGLATVQYRGRPHRSKTYVIDKTGSQIAAIPLTRVERFSEGLAAASPPDSYTRGYIDLSGRWVIPPQFDNALPFSHGLAEVQRGDWYAIIDKTGAFIWGPTPEGSTNQTLAMDWT
jgi:hypothetical protein